MANVLKARRVDLGLTQADVASFLEAKGVFVRLQTVSSWESAKSQPKMKDIRVWAEVLGLTFMPVLLDGSDGGFDGDPWKAIARLVDRRPDLSVSVTMPRQTVVDLPTALYHLIRRTPPSVSPLLIRLLWWLGFVDHHRQALEPLARTVELMSSEPDGAELWVSEWEMKHGEKLSHLVHDRISIDTAKQRLGQDISERRQRMEQSAVLGYTEILTEEADAANVPVAMLLEPAWEDVAALAPAIEALSDLGLALHEGTYLHRENAMVAVIRLSREPRYAPALRAAFGASGTRLKEVLEACRRLATQPAHYPRTIRQMVSQAYVELHS